MAITQAIANSFKKELLEADAILNKLVVTSLK